MKKLLFIFAMICGSTLAHSEEQTLTQFALERMRVEIEARHVPGARTLLFGTMYSEKADFDLIAAYQPAREDLQRIQKSLKDGGLLVLIYHPRESKHWQVADSAEPLSIEELLQEVNRLGFEIIASDFSHCLAAYDDLEDFTADVKSWPQVWGEDISAAQEKARMQNWRPHSREILLPFNLISLTLKK